MIRFQWSPVTDRLDARQEQLLNTGTGAPVTARGKLALLPRAALPCAELRGSADCTAGLPVSLRAARRGILLTDGRTLSHAMIGRPRRTSKAK
jgi:hypothetical protein